MTREEYAAVLARRVADGALSEAEARDRLANDDYPPVPAPLTPTETAAVLANPEAPGAPTPASHP